MPAPDPSDSTSVPALAPRLVVYGDVMLDTYVSGVVRRVSPEAPVPVVEVEGIEHRAGGAANAAANAAALGARVCLGGAVGTDAPAEELGRVAALSTSGGTKFVREDRPTTVKTRVTVGGQQVARYDIESRRPIGRETELAVIAWMEEAVSQADACVLSDYAKGAVTERLARHLAGLAGVQGVPLVVDPKGTNFAKYSSATVVTPNTHELGLALGVHVESDVDVERHGRTVLERAEMHALLVTRGSRGVSLLQRDKETLHVRSTARSVFDVTGAGDAVVVSLAIALASAIPLEDAVRVANVAGGLAVGLRGTAAVTRSALEEACAQGGLPTLP